MPSVNITYTDSAELERKFRIVMNRLDGFRWMTPGEIAKKTRRTLPSISRALRGPACPMREFHTGPSGRIVRVLVSDELLKWLKR